MTPSWTNLYSAYAVTKSIVHTTVWGCNKYKVLHVSKTKLARRGMLLDCLPITPTRSFNTANVYSTIEINKKNLLVGHKLCLIWRVLVRKRDYVIFSVQRGGWVAQKTSLKITFFLKIKIWNWFSTFFYMWKALNCSILINEMKVIKIFSLWVGIWECAWFSIVLYSVFAFMVHSFLCVILLIAMISGLFCVFVLSCLF